MQTLADLGNRMRKLATDIPVQANELKKKIVRTIETDLVYVTPVDTSQALSNWQVDKSPITTFIPPWYPGSGGSSQAQSAQEAIAEMEGVLSSIQPGEAVYIGNAAPYIRQLNDVGTSKQEPAGFFERAVLLGRKTIQNTKLLK